MQSKPRYPFGRTMPVIVEWEDSASSGRWGTRDDYHKKAKSSLGPIRSVGWLNRSDRTAVQLLQSQSAANGDVADAVTIPRGCVRRIIRLKG
jgi:hypothetical protein